jgi:ABC-type multidrug transport system permease subunit
MIRLAAVLYILTATVFAGSAVVAVLTLQRMTPIEILAAFALGLVLALPVALLVARNVYNAFNSREL